MEWFLPGEGGERVQEERIAFAKSTMGEGGGRRGGEGGSQLEGTEWGSSLESAGEPQILKNVLLGKIPSTPSRQ